MAHTSLRRATVGAEGTSPPIPKEMGGALAITSVTCPPNSLIVVAFCPFAPQMAMLRQSGGATRPFFRVQKTFRGAPRLTRRLTRRRKFRPVGTRNGVVVRQAKGLASRMEPPLFKKKGRRKPLVEPCRDDGAPIRGGGTADIGGTCRASDAAFSPARDGKA